MGLTGGRYGDISSGVSGAALTCLMAVNVVNYSNNVLCGRGAFRAGAKRGHLLVAGPSCRRARLA